MCQTYECRPWTPPSIWADMVRFSNLSSPEYIMDLVKPHTAHKCQENIQMRTFKWTLANSDLPKNGQTLCSYVLTAMLDSRYEVRDKLVYGALVLYWSWHTLGHLHPVPLTGITTYLCWCEPDILWTDVNHKGHQPEVTLLAIVFLHGVQGAHSSVLFQTHAIRKKVLSWSFRGRCQQGPHHDLVETRRKTLLKETRNEVTNNRWTKYSCTCRCPQGQSLHHMSNGLNPAIGDDRHPETSGVLCNLVDRCTLGPPACHHCTRLIGYKLGLVSDSKGCEWSLHCLSLYCSIPSWVMQMEPQPMPTLRASTPASIRFFAWAAVTTRERQRHRKVVGVGVGMWNTSEKPWDRSRFYHFHQPPGVQGISAWCSLSCWFGTLSFLGRSPANNMKRSSFITRLQFLFGSTCSQTYKDNHIHPSLHEEVQPVFIIFPCTDSSSAQQLFAGVLGSQRIIPVLLQVSPGNYGHQLITVVHNRELTLIESEDQN